MIPIVGVLLRMLRRARVCPNCGQEQIVPSEQKREAVPCKSCGTMIPPPDG